MEKIAKYIQVVLIIAGAVVSVAGLAAVIAVKQMAHYMMEHLGRH